MTLRLPLALCACLMLATPAHAARTGTLCIAPSDPAEAGAALSELESIEFYLDGGNPLIAYTVPFTRLDSVPDSAGRTVNEYGVSGSPKQRAHIVFADETPLTVTLEETGTTVATLARDDRGTTFMADAIPGIACWRVEKEAP
jgi:hypothetical protein